MGETSMTPLPKKLFVAGTDTDVGKTLVAAMLVMGLDGYFWKPVQSGSDEGTDTNWIREKTGLPSDRFFPETYRLKAYLSPHAAAALENVTIDFSAIRMPILKSSGTLVMEGAGGLMVPLNDGLLMVDLIRKLSAPVIMVARSSLGTINHTLLSLEKLNAFGIEVVGVVMNGPKDEVSRKAVEHFGKTRVLAQIEPMQKINPETLAEAYERYFG